MALLMRAPTAMPWDWEKLSFQGAADESSHGDAMGLRKAALSGRCWWELPRRAPTAMPWDWEKLPFQGAAEIH